MGHTLLKNVKVISLEPGVREVMSVSGKRTPRARPQGKRGCCDLWTDGRVKERKGEACVHLTTRAGYSRDGDKAQTG